MQISKVPHYHNQLNFNLDFSSPGSSAYNSNSPQVILLQKVPPGFKATAFQPETASPKSNKLNLAIKIAKLDVSNHIQEGQHRLKKPHKKPKNKPLPGSKTNSYGRFFKNNVQFKPHIPMSLVKAAKMPKHVTKIPCKLYNLKPYSDSAIKQSKLLNSTRHAPVKDVGTSTDDRSIQFIKPNATEYSPISKAKVDTSLKQSTPITKTGLPCCQTPSKKSPTPLSTITPNPVKQQMFLKKSKANQKLVDKGKLNLPKTKQQFQNNQSFKINHGVNDTEINHCPYKPHLPDINEKTDIFLDCESKPVVNEEVNSMCKSLYQRLLDMEDTERDIRSRWMEIKYNCLREPTDEVLCQQEYCVPEKPEVVDIIGGKTTPKIKKEAVRFTNKKMRGSPKSQFLNSKPSQTHQKLLHLPSTIVESVYQNKSNYSNYLHRTFHEPKGNFDPWSIVNEMSEEIVNEMLNQVCDEVNEDFDVCVEQLFENEFANPNNSHHYSFM